MSRLRVAVAGASGFVGRALCARLAERAEVRALSRREREGSGGVRWVAADLYSLLDCERALEGVDVAVYLVHSMAPSARLTQGSFRDMDLLLADNFARAAATCGVRQIVYLGGLIPEQTDGEDLSAHLASRLEVEDALAAHGVPVTTLRAGLVIGAGGSSFRMLSRLVGRLPVMACPAWTRTPAQPIALDDVVALLDKVIGSERDLAQVYDVAGPDVVSYRRLIEVTARLMGKRRLLMSVPLFSPGLSRLWVSLVTGTPRALAAPLIRSLRCPMVAGDRRLQERLEMPGMDLETSLRVALDAEAADDGGPAPPKPADTPAPVAISAPESIEGTGLSSSASMIPASMEQPAASGQAVSILPRKARNTVRSVQRLPNPHGRTAQSAASLYLRWLPRFLRPLLRVQSDADGHHIRLLGLRLLTLRDAPGRSRPDRVLLYVTGGALARPDLGKGRLEFREVLGGRFLISAIHDFVPRLPWFVYILSQAVVHLIVMRAFGRFLRRPEAVTERLLKESAA